MYFGRVVELPTREHRSVTCTIPQRECCLAAYRPGKRGGFRAVAIYPTVVLRARAAWPLAARSYLASSQTEEDGRAIVRPLNGTDGIDHAGALRSYESEIKGGVVDVE